MDIIKIKFNKYTFLKQILFKHQNLYKNNNQIIYYSEKFFLLINLKNL